MFVYNLYLAVELWMVELFLIFEYPLVCLDYPQFNYKIFCLDFRVALLGFHACKSIDYKLLLLLLLSLFEMTATSMYFVNASVMTIFCLSWILMVRINQCVLFDLVQCTVVRELIFLILSYLKWALLLLLRYFVEINVWALLLF
jgi:hypothetical protein